MFTPTKAELGVLLGSSTVFTIPTFQRPFNWGKGEAEELIEDLEAHLEMAEPLFLGNFILQPVSEHKTEIIDGQQRMTTIMLLLIACRLRASELKLYALAGNIQTRITFTDPSTAESLGPRLVPSKTVQEVYKHISTDAWNGTFPAKLGAKEVKRQVNRLRPILEIFRKYTSELDKERLSALLKTLYSSFVVKIEIADTMDALSIFERTNARGLELEISDLLKNYLFAKLGPGVEERWTMLVENSCESLLRMIKQYYVSREGAARKALLYKMMKKRAERITPAHFSLELQAFSEYYKLTRQPENGRTHEFFEKLNCVELSGDQHRYESITGNLQALKLFSVVQANPPTYAAIERYSRTPDSAGARALVRLCDAFENYHFINNVVCERVGNEVEQLYADACVTFNESQDLVKDVNGLIQSLKNRLAREDEFIAGFTQLCYSEDFISELSYIFDRFVNRGLTPGQRVPIWDPSIRLRRRNHNIEHIMPQNPDFEISAKTRESIDSIGNLLILPFKANAKLGNVKPEIKFEKLTGDMRRDVQRIPYVQEFVTAYAAQGKHWNHEVIQARAEAMAKEAYNSVWKIK